MILQLQNFFLKSWQYRPLFTIGFSLLVASMVNHFYSQSHGYALIITAFFVSLATMGAPLRYALKTIVSVMIMFLFVFFLYTVSVFYFIAYIVSGLIFICVAYYLFKNRPQPKINDTQSLLFILLFLFTVFTFPVSAHNVKEIVADIVIGGLIGTLSLVLFLTISPAKNFRLSLSVFLTHFTQYVNVLINYRLFQKDSLTLLQVMRQTLENVYIHSDIYPEWVYEPGFNPGLRSGFRFFLINLEAVMDHYLTLDYLLARKFDVEVDNNLRELIYTAINKNNELLFILKRYFEEHSLTEGSADFTSDVLSLEKKVSQLIPANLELLDISPDYVLLTAILRNIKDTREILLQLISALPQK